MRSTLGVAIDKRLAQLIIVRLRRAWPLLRVIPASWIVPVVAPGARTLRRSLLACAVVVVLSTGALIVLIALRA
jgi:hypothetical protein